MSQENTSEVLVGQSAPDFSAYGLSGDDVRFSSVARGKKTLLLFYRGGWCPFCNQQLAAIARDFQKFEEQKVIVVAVSGEEVQKGKDLLQKLHLPFVLLSDTSFEGIDKYGVRDTNISDKVRERGITQLAKPAAFIIDRTGVVRYRYIGKNAPDRPKNEDLLLALAEAEIPMQTSG